MAFAQPTTSIDPTVTPEAVTEERMRQRFPLGLALSFAALALGLSGFLLAADDGTSAVEVLRLILFVAWLGAGTAMMVRRAPVQLGLVVLAGTTAASLCALANGLLVEDGTGGTGDIAEVARPLVLGLLPAFGFHLLLGLPDGILHTRARQVSVAMGYAAGLAIGAGIWMERPEVPRWPIAVAAVAALLMGAPASHHRYRIARGRVRQRLQWLGLATALVAETALVMVALRLLVDWPDDPLAVVAAATIAIPAAMVVGTTRRLVSRIDRVLTHAVSLTGLTTVVVAVYVVVILGLGRTPDSDEREVLVLSMLAAGVSVALFSPARERLADVANRLVYGERRAPDEALHTFGSRMTRALPLDELLLQLAESLHKSMTLASSEVWTGADGFLQRAASVPDRDSGELRLGEKELPVVARAGVSGPAWSAIWLPALLEGRPPSAPLRVAPVTHSGEVLGLLVVQRRAGDDEFGEEEERVLTELARQLGLALHNSQLDTALQASLEQVRQQARELQKSRARIVAAGDAERRKIERNLHDGAQQHLVALAVKLRLIEQIAEADADAAKAMLGEARQEVQDTVEALRTLAHGIYPPLLMDRGLPEALRAAAGRAVLSTVVEADGVGRYPQEVEAAVYFCCLEALQNAGKHAGEGASVRISIEQQGEELRFEVADDGQGFDTATQGQGHGFLNMADRVGAIGGAVEITSAPGAGTRIAGRLAVTPSPV